MKGSKIDSGIFIPDITPPSGSLDTSNLKYKSEFDKQREEDQKEIARIRSSAERPAQSWNHGVINLATKLGNKIASGLRGLLRTGPQVITESDGTVFIDGIMLEGNAVPFTDNPNMWLLMDNFWLSRTDDNKLQIGLLSDMSNPVAILENYNFTNPMGSFGFTLGKSFTKQTGELTKSINIHGGFIRDGILKPDEIFITQERNFIPLEDVRGRAMIYGIKNNINNGDEKIACLATLDSRGVITEIKTIENVADKGLATSLTLQYKLPNGEFILTIANQIGLFFLKVNSFGQVLFNKLFEFDNSDFSANPSFLFNPENNDCYISYQKDGSNLFQQFSIDNGNKIGVVQQGYPTGTFIDPQLYHESTTLKNGATIRIEPDMDHITTTHPTYSDMTPEETPLTYLASGKVDISPPEGKSALAATIILQAGAKVNFIPRSGENFTLKLANFEAATADNSTSVNIAGEDFSKYNITECSAAVLPLGFVAAAEVAKAIAEKEEYMDSGAETTILTLEDSQKIVIPISNQTFVEKNINSLFTNYTTPTTAPSSSATFSALPFIEYIAAIGTGIAAVKTIEKCQRRQQGAVRFTPLTPGTIINPLAATAPAVTQEPARGGIPVSL